MDPEDIQHRLSYHKPDETQQRRHQAARDIFMTAAHALNDAVPEGREKSLVMTNLEQALFWANAAIARDIPRRKEP